jgi:hypothetical protein
MTEYTERQGTDLNETLVTVSFENGIPTKATAQYIYGSQEIFEIPLDTKLKERAMMK